MWNRDINAARSFRIIWLHCVRNGGVRPAAFARTVNANLPDPSPPAIPDPVDVVMDEAGEPVGLD